MLAVKDEIERFKTTWVLDRADTELRASESGHLSNPCLDCGGGVMSPKFEAFGHSWIIRLRVDDDDSVYLSLFEVTENDKKVHSHNYGTKCACGCFYSKISETLEKPQNITYCFKIKTCPENCTSLLIETKPRTLEIQHNFLIPEEHYLCEKEQFAMVCTDEDAPTKHATIQCCIFRPMCEKPNLKILYENEKTKDVELVCKDGSTIKTHKAILIAQCPFFESLFNFNIKNDILGNHNQNRVEISSLHDKTIAESLLHFLYLGSLPIIKDAIHMIHLLELADLLTLPKLSTECVVHLKQLITIEIIPDLFHFLRRYLDESMQVYKDTPHFASELLEIIYDLVNEKPHLLGKLFLMFSQVHDNQVQKPISTDHTKSTEKTTETKTSLGAKFSLFAKKTNDELNHNETSHNEPNHNETNHNQEKPAKKRKINT